MVFSVKLQICLGLLLIFEVVWELGSILDFWFPEGGIAQSKLDQFLWDTLYEMVILG